MVAKSCPTLATSWTVARQAPLSMGFPKYEYWSGLPFPPLGDLPDLGIEPTSSALAGRIFTSEPPGKPAIKQNPNLLNFFTQGLFIASLWHNLMQGIGEGGASHPQSFRELGFLDDGDHDLEPWSPQLWTK